MRLYFIQCIFIFAFLSGRTLAADPYTDGVNAISKMTGCFLVDYNYTETEALKPGYAIDKRVYDVNSVRSVKEWIYLETITPRRLRLQHILFATDLDGKVLEERMLKHQAEDWRFEAPFLYDFNAPDRWAAKPGVTPGAWMRSVTNLDDGLRYQCAAKWSGSNAYPEWSCDNYAPIPGRETRDMKRSDYNTLQRSTRIIVYGDSWLERQDNVKTVHDTERGQRTELAREAGKNWYVRLPEAECEAPRIFAKPRIAFWSLLRELWDETLDGAADFVEMKPKGASPRFVRIGEIEEKYISLDLSLPDVRAAAKRELLEIINEYRAKN